MGEEKPDEELMGKRKSSPRLSPALLAPVLPLWPNPREIYLPFVKFRQRSALHGGFAFAACRNVVT